MTTIERALDACSRLDWQATASDLRRAQRDCLFGREKEASVEAYAASVLAAAARQG